MNRVDLPNDNDDEAEPVEATPQATRGLGRDQSCDALEEDCDGYHDETRVATPDEPDADEESQRLFEELGRATDRQEAARRFLVATDLRLIVEQAEQIRAWLTALGAEMYWEDDLNLALQSNVERLMARPPEVRLRWLQAIGRFRSLTVPLLLDQDVRPFGYDKGDRPLLAAARVPELERAIERGEPLVDALAAFYQVSKGFVRSDLHADYWYAATLGERRSLLRIIDLLPKEARPTCGWEIDKCAWWLGDYAPLVGWEEETLPLELWRRVHRAAFRKGWEETTLYVGADLDLADTRLVLSRLCDLLRKLDPALATLTPTQLARAWLLETDLLNLVDSARCFFDWEDRNDPLVHRPGLRLLPLIGVFRGQHGCAWELLTKEALVAEGQAQGHCVANFWRECVAGARVFALESDRGERATVMYACEDAEQPHRHYTLAQIRGPQNRAVGKEVAALAAELLRSINRPERLARRQWALGFLERLRAAHPAERSSEGRLPWADLPNWWRRTLERVIRRLPEASFAGQWVLARTEQVLDREARREILCRVGDQLELRREATDPQSAPVVQARWRGRVLAAFDARLSCAILEHRARGATLWAQVEAISEGVQAASVSLAIWVRHP
ncbi:MAG: hypothetical protein N3F11_06445 [Casimicrobiaceae bacterium]|nr:hypothetical protein [Casimicrobiaceae bacterium]